MIENKITEILAKYSAPIAVAAILANVIMFLIKKRLKIPRRINSVLPFVSSIIICFLAFPLAGGNLEEVAKNAITAGGLASVLYSVTGGYYSEEEDELKKLLATLLKNVVPADKIEEAVGDLWQSVNDSESDESLITVKISDLIKKYLNGEADGEKVELVTAVFVQAWHKLKAENK
ncbi:MAG: hypothetical protein SOX77_03010 [Candidatus Borkfalkiaceae bacterium]|nr:hypothetical protein [Christensenellaceae bacterium]